jgi:LysM repeat protein
MANKPANSSYQKGEYASVKFHTVQKGESLFRIAQNNGMKLDELCKLNNIKAKTSIRPGQRLRLS